MAIFAFVDCASSTAFAATRAASEALLAISATDAVISSTAVATVDTLWLTCSPPAATTLDCAEVSSAFAPICVLTAVSSAAAAASVSELSRIDRREVRRLSIVARNESASSPISSLEW